MFRIDLELLPGVFVLEHKRFEDNRGSFFKIFQDELFTSLGIDFQPKEYFYSTSKKNVIRGMHFQVGKYSHDKLVYCSEGNLIDVIVDVRRNSKNFNKPVSFELSGSDSKMIFISKGYAHGFLSKSRISTMHYFTSTVHSPMFDRAVLWSSINFDWNIKKPILSQRDLSHPSIHEIKCEFS